MASRSLKIHCSQCGAYVISYYKKGSGTLLYLYLDCIEPDKSDVQFKNLSSAGFAQLVCPQCNQPMGFPVKHDSRRAWRLIPGSFRKK